MRLGGDMRGYMDWTKPGIRERLRYLYEETGTAAPQIAIELAKESGCDCTKDAVIGKAHRWGFKAHPSRMKGDNLERIKISPEQVAQIHAKWTDGHDKARISRDVGVSPKSVARILGPDAVGVIRPKPQDARKASVQRKTTDAEEAEISRLYATGKVAMSELGHRFAVSRVTIGRILGLPNGRKMPEPRLPPLESIRLGVDHILAAPRQVATPIPKPFHSACCWPTGERTSVYHTWRYCDGPTVAGKPYCLDHCKIAYQRRGDREDAA